MEQQQHHQPAQEEKCEDCEKQPLSPPTNPTTLSTDSQTTTPTDLKFPRIAITFCLQCRWTLRAAYFAQELLSTFNSSIGEIALIPTTGGVFTVNLTYLPAPPHADDRSKQNQPVEVREVLLWDREAEGGFPETKVLKQLVRNFIAPEKGLGHSDGPGKRKSTNAVASTNGVVISDSSSTLIATPAPLSSSVEDSGDHSSSTQAAEYLAPACGALMNGDGGHQLPSSDAAISLDPLVQDAKANAAIAFEIPFPVVPIDPAAATPPTADPLMHTAVRTTSIASPLQVKIRLAQEYEEPRLERKPLSPFANEIITTGNLAAGWQAEGEDRSS